MKEQAYIQDLINAGYFSQEILEGNKWADGCKTKTSSSSCRKADVTWAISDCYFVLLILRVNLMKIIKITVVKLQLLQLLQLRSILPLGVLSG
jgi:hypothetical protein